MLYLHYTNTGFHPIILDGENIKGKAKIEDIVNKAYTRQYDSSTSYWQLPKNKKILIINDVHNKKANNDNYSLFLQSITHTFEYAIIFIDKLSSLLIKSPEIICLQQFNNYTIRSLRYQKRDELIKKCISNNDGTEFDANNNEQVAKLDRDTHHINTIIGSNIVPSYPIFIVSTFSIIESATAIDMTRTSYGHCYHAMITLQLNRKNVEADDIDMYFNFLTELAYFMFSIDEKNTSEEKFEKFIEEYESKYYFEREVLKKLKESNILVQNNQDWSFRYIYIYYYFVSKYIADNISDDIVEKQVGQILSTIHKKDSSNIVVFITHHTKNQNLIDSILSHTKSTFEKFTEATLNKEETKSISKREKIRIPNDYDPNEIRKKQLKEKDKHESVKDKIGNDIQQLSSRSQITFEHFFSREMQYTQLDATQIWVRMEAIGKMTSQGLNLGMRSLFSIATGACEAPSNCYFVDFKLSEKLLGTVCVKA